MQLTRSQLTSIDIVCDCLHIVPHKLCNQVCSFVWVQQNSSDSVNFTSIIIQYGSTIYRDHEG